MTKEEARVWGEVQLNKGQTRHWQVRRRRLWLRREEDRWLYATDLLGSPGVGALVSGARKAQDLPWESIVGIADRPPLLSPALPNKPILLKAPNPVQILPAGELYLLIAVPLWLQLTSDVPIIDVETDPLSRTWFGDAQAGEPAYALEIADWMVGGSPQSGGAHAYVPLRIKNDSQSLLSFQRLLVRVVHLSLYREDDLFFTNDVSVTFKSVDTYSHLNFSKQPSLGHGTDVASVVQEPRVRVSDSLIKRSFLFFRALTE